MPKVKNPVLARVCDGDEPVILSFDCNSPDGLPDCFIALGKWLRDNGNPYVIGTTIDFTIEECYALVVTVDFSNVEGNVGIPHRTHYGV